MEDNAIVLLLSKILVNIKVPVTQRSRKEHNQGVLKRLILLQFTKTEDANARECYQLDDKEEEKCDQVLQHGHRRSDQRSKRIRQLKHEDQPDPKQKCSPCQKPIKVEVTRVDVVQESLHEDVILVWWVSQIETLVCIMDVLFKLFKPECNADKNR